jgi:leucyl aminopeptidase
MSKIYLSQNPQAIQIRLVNQIPENNSNLQNFKFKAKFGQLAFDNNILYVGTIFKNSNVSIDPFNKPDYYALGAKVVAFLKATEYKQFEVNCQFVIGNKQLEHLLLGLLQNCYNFDKYLKKPKTSDFNFYLSQSLAQLVSDRQLKYIQAVSNSVDLARNLVNDTPAAINPSTMPLIIEQQFKGLDNVSIKQLSYEQMLSLGMEGITAVGKASEHKPVLVHTIIKPKTESRKRIVLIGKGLTYDSGGLDIKTAGHMQSMKSDMGGSATMFGTTLALAKLGLNNLEVHWISAFAENMIDSNAYKADDILTTYSGQTVEVYNTDAEGRLTLADALTYATLLEPDYIVDAATLTGACVMALSEYNTALMSNNLSLKDKLINKFEVELEPTIYTPMPETLRQYVAGDISDLNNTSTLSRQSGHTTAGLFLSHFVDQNNFRNPKLEIKSPKCYPWVHLDIAGSAYNNKHNSLNVKGATGQSIRSLVSWVLDEDKL